MADRSNIEWTDASWTPIRAQHKATGKVGWHCTHATPGCVNCYAEGLNKRLGTGLAFKPGHAGEIELFLDEEMLLAPLRWKKPRMIFVCSMTDLFADFVPDEWIDKLFAVMALTPHHTYQVLTKRSARMRSYCTTPGAYRRIGALICDMAIDLRLDVVLIAPGTDERQAPPGRRVHLDRWPLPNVWLGVSAEDQQRADERIPDLLATPAAIRFVSAEPLLAPIDFEPWLNWKDLGAEVDGKSWGCQGCDDGCPSCPQGKAHYHVEEGPWDEAEGHPEWVTATRVTLDWIIVGGESGREARPMHPDWARQIRDQCAAAGTAFFFKQWGEWVPPPGYLPSVEWSQGSGAGEVAWPDGTIGHGRMEEHGGAGCMLQRVGKKRAGRLLDGVQHDAMPEVSLD